ncbi:PAS domain-containing protein [Paenibacillus sp. 1A_MP2]|uniref:PAS domain-containing protein n=1 Tax=Paenibacillus sp. 1A_MP2 TaxID=3457495 RepID=UPI003FCDD697
MKHLLPSLMSLLRTDMSILDSGLCMPVIPSTTGLADAIPLFNTSPYLLIQDDGPSLGYIAVSDVLQEMMHAHRLMEAYFETTLETAGSALTLINEDAKVTYWTSGAEHVFSINKKDIIGKPAADFFPLIDSNRSKRYIQGKPCTESSTSQDLICSP